MKPTPAQRRVLEELVKRNHCIRYSQWAGPSSTWIRLVKSPTGVDYQDVRWDTYYALAKHGWIAITWQSKPDEYPKQTLYIISPMGREAIQ